MALSVRRAGAVGRGDPCRFFFLWPSRRLPTEGAPSSLHRGRPRCTAADRAAPPATLHRRKARRCAAATARWLTDNAGPWCGAVARVAGGVTCVGCGRGRRTPAGAWMPWCGRRLGRDREGGEVAAECFFFFSRRPSPPWLLCEAALLGGHGRHPSQRALASWCACRVRRSPCPRPRECPTATAPWQVVRSVMHSPSLLAHAWGGARAGAHDLALLPSPPLPPRGPLSGPSSSHCRPRTLKVRRGCRPWLRRPYM